MFFEGTKKLWFLHHEVDVEGPVVRLLSPYWKFFYLSLPPFLSLSHLVPPPPPVVGIDLIRVIVSGCVKMLPSGKGKQLVVGHRKQIWAEHQVTLTRVKLISLKGCSVFHFVLHVSI